MITPTTTPSAAGKIRVSVIQVLVTITILDHPEIVDTVETMKECAPRQLQKLQGNSTVMVVPRLRHHRYQISAAMAMADTVLTYRGKTIPSPQAVKAIHPILLAVFPGCQHPVTVMEVAVQVPVVVMNIR